MSKVKKLIELGEKASRGGEWKQAKWKLYISLFSRDLLPILRVAEKMAEYLASLPRDIDSGPLMAEWDKVNE